MDKYDTIREEHERTARIVRETLQSMLDTIHTTEKSMLDSLGALSNKLDSSFRCIMGVIIVSGISVWLACGVAAYGSH